MIPAVGDRLPVRERLLDAAALMAYGAATWDWHRLHYDRAYVEARGLEGPVADGQMFGALCAQAVVAWLGPRAFITRLGYRMRSMVFAGDRIRLEGEVVAREPADGHWLLTLEQRGYARGRVAVQATTVVRVPEDPPGG